MRVSRTLHRSLSACVSAGIASPALRAVAQQYAAQSSLFSFMDKLSRDLRAHDAVPKGSLPREGLFDTIAHQQLFQKLGSYAKTLVGGGFERAGDVAGVTVVGARGIGKTTALLAFQAIANLVFPSLIPVYISYLSLSPRADSPKHCQECRSYLREFSLVDILAQVLERDIGSGVIAKTSDVVAIEQALKLNNKHLLLLLDDMDTLYECAPTDVHRSTLIALAAMGDLRAGRIATLLCGSSTTLPTLISAQHRAEPAHVKRHPLLAAAPDLNEQKFRTWRLESSVPTDASAVARIAGNPRSKQNSTPPEFSELANLICFAAGATSRNVSRLVLQRNLIAVADLRSLLVDENIHAAETLLPNSAPATLLHIIMNMLQSKNAALLNDLRNTEGDLDPESICKGNWTQRFQPLEWREAEDAYIGAVSSSNSHDEFQVWIQYLCDRDYVFFSEAFEYGRPTHVYPCSLLQLFTHNMPADERTPHLQAMVNALRTKHLRLREQLCSKGFIQQPSPFGLQVEAANGAATEEKGDIHKQLHGVGSIRQLGEFMKNLAESTL